MYNKTELENIFDNNLTENDMTEINQKIKNVKSSDIEDDFKLFDNIDMFINWFYLDTDDVENATANKNNIIEELVAISKSNDQITINPLEFLLGESATALSSGKILFEYGV